ncbi:UDP-glucose dehydrogenase family protein [Bacillus alveayuensis]|uniref:UDP-glucose dehydrogenase family protein n=1 Tax=Aeribacillus alveayuensis TaxID=279215 RepID=UPI0005CDAFE9|nr:UDP-glucose/GDP-mannose dehydrogenase family protein [Bacillus alveayuensis]
MNICIIGTGYVGLTTAAVLADIGHHVTCLDNDPNKINSLQKGIITIYEPDLEDYLKRNKTRLSFTLNMKQAIEPAEVIFITVGTPSNDDGSPNLTYLFNALDELSKYMNSYKTIVIKSTVPPGTNIQCHQRLQQNGVNQELYSIVSNPEFLREGSAVYDSRNPDRIVIGKQKEDHKSISIMKSVYEGINAPFVVTSLSGAEMIKYASNAFLAAKISFINEMAQICDQYDVDVNDVAKGIGLDPRIGPHFLQAGIGYGGSCFPKDLQALEFSAKKKNIHPHLLKAVQTVNHAQSDYFLKKVKEHFPNTLCTLAALGIAFKPNTDDIRYSPAIKIMKELHEKGYTIHSYDPKATLPNELKHILQFRSPYEAMKNVNGLLILTDWDEHKNLDWKKVKQFMKGQVIIDGRNCLDPDVIKQHGFTYIGVGR